MHPIALLDLDGTLVDSAPDLHAALDRLMVARGLPGFARAEVTAMIGDGAAVLVRRAFAARGGTADDAAIAAFLHDYEAHAAVETRPFPGMLDAMDRLVAAGWRIALCTNKPARATAALLGELRLQARFAAIGAGDSFAVKKPDPGHLLGTLAACGGEPGAAVMVGDHRNDIAAAQAAGIPAVFAAWGYGAPDMAAGAAAIAAAPRQLPDILARLLA